MANFDGVSDTSICPIKGTQFFFFFQRMVKILLDEKLFYLLYIKEVVEQIVNINGMKLYIRKDLKFEFVWWNAETWGESGFVVQHIIYRIAFLNTNNNITILFLKINKLSCPWFYYPFLQKKTWEKGNV